MGLVVLTVVVAGCGPETAQADRDGGAVAAPTTTTDDALSQELPPSTSATVIADTVTPAPSPPPVPAPASASAPLEPEVLVSDPVSIHTARVVVNQSNVVNTGGSSGSSTSSARSVVESEAAVLVVQQSLSGLEIVSLDVRPGWVEAARSDSPERLTLRYVLGTAAVDISVWSNGSGIASSVSSGFDR
jgi:hypothetical protein